MALLKSNVSSHRNVEHRYYFPKYTPSYATLCKTLSCKNTKNTQVPYGWSQRYLFSTFYHSVCIYVHTYMYKTKMKEKDVWPLLLMHRLLYQRWLGLANSSLYFGRIRTRVGRGSLFKIMLPCPDALTDLQIWVQIWS